MQKGAYGPVRGELPKYGDHQQLLCVHGNRDGVCVPTHLVEKYVSLVLLQLFAQPIIFRGGAIKFRARV